MALCKACEHHIIHMRRTPGSSIKLYAECRVQSVDHQLIRAHLDTQSMGPGCQSVKPAYRAIPMSTLLVSGAPLNCDLTVNPAQHLCCYRSVIAEPFDSPSQAIQLSVQHVLTRTPFNFDTPHCTLTMETICDQVKGSDLIVPTFAQKENGTVYLPICTTHPDPFVIELFQVWREPTFAALEQKSVSDHNKEPPVFGIRVSAVPTSITADKLYRTTQALLKFVDLLVYG